MVNRHRVKCSQTQSPEKHIKRKQEVPASLPITADYSLVSLKAIRTESFWFSLKGLDHNMPKPVSHPGRVRGKAPEHASASAEGKRNVDLSVFDASEKDASQITTALWNDVMNTLNFSNTTDFDNAARGFIAAPDNLVIGPSESPIWDMKTYEGFIQQDTAAPFTVNPSLWRMSQLNMFYGLFEVTENIYQVRGYDLSNISFIRGTSGWIVIDPLISAECAASALSLVNYELYTKHKMVAPPVVAVIYSHSHTDHYGGVGGIVGPNDRENIDIYASKGFTEHAVSENVIAGNAMSRRAIYMYGSLLEKSAKGSVCAGLGMTTSNGSTGLLKPNKIISDEYETMDIDGINVEFQFTPGTEAPTEMNTWFIDWDVLWMAENTTNTMHNLLTLRGAQVRDALVWSEYLTNTINRYGPTAKVKFQSHHWPIWGNNEILVYLKKQRAIYQYTHDQSVRLMNKGYVGTEIASVLQLPDSLQLEWSTRGYYGTLSHNSHAVYQRYMGWYSGNPSDLNKLPQEEAAHKYVDYMGGEENIIAKAAIDFHEGNYRWVAEVMRHVVFSNPQNEKARYLLADAYEQLGYQAESGAWRGCYLQGAFELRYGKPTSGFSTISEDVVKNMEPSMLFTYWGVHLDPKKANGLSVSVVINLTNTDLDDGVSPTYTLTVEDCTLIQSPEAVQNPDAVITTTLEKLFELFLSQDSDAFLNDSGVSISEGGNQYVQSLFEVFDTEDDLWFNIIEP